MDDFSTRTMKIAVLTTRLGDFDKPVKYEPQSVEADYFVYDAPLRFNSMTPRLQAKIPKMFGWQLYPDYDMYVWMDGNIGFNSPDALKHLVESIKDHDVAVFHHPDRNTIWWEYRYNWRAIHNNKPSRYMQVRYINELLDEQMQVIKEDKDYKDDYLVNGGVFIYRNTPEVQKMLKEWWYHVSRYLIMDQLSWAYVLRKSGLKVNVLKEDIKNCEWFDLRGHK